MNWNWNHYAADAIWSRSMCTSTKVVVDHLHNWVRLLYCRRDGSRVMIGEAHLARPGTCWHLFEWAWQYVWQRGIYSEITQQFYCFRNSTPMLKVIHQFLFWEPHVCGSRTCICLVKTGLCLLSPPPKFNGRHWPLVHTHEHSLKYKMEKDHANADVSADSPLQEKPGEVPRVGETVLLLKVLQTTACMHEWNSSSWDHSISASCTIEPKSSFNFPLCTKVRNACKELL